MPLRARLPAPNLSNVAAPPEIAPLMLLAEPVLVTLTALVTAIEAAVRLFVVTFRLVNGPPTAPVKVVFPTVVVARATAPPVKVDPKNRSPPPVEESVVGVAVRVTAPVYDWPPEVVIVLVLIVVEPLTERFARRVTVSLGASPKIAFAATARLAAPPPVIVPSKVAVLAVKVVLAPSVTAPP